MNIVIVAYSMGGLMARDMIAKNRRNVAVSCKINALITLGTPYLGYPGSSLDTQLGPFVGTANPYEMSEMRSDFRSQSEPNVLLSLYLSALEGTWSNLTSLKPSYWYALSGSLCSQAIRTGDTTNTYGCPDYNKTSDGVVCEQSSQYKSGGPVKPNKTQGWDGFAHSPQEIMCNPVPGQPVSVPNSFNAVYQGQPAKVLYDPPSASLTFLDVMAYIAGHCCGQ